LRNCNSGGPGKRFGTYIFESILDDVILDGGGVETKIEGFGNEGGDDEMWFKSRSRKDRPLTPASAQLVEESEAFLSGTFARVMRVRGDEVPGWARLNAFARGDLSITDDF
jgi:hypothetical protein